MQKKDHKCGFMGTPVSDIRGDVRRWQWSVLACAARDANHHGQQDGAIDMPAPFLNTLLTHHPQVPGIEPNGWVSSLWCQRRLRDRFQHGRGVPSAVPARLPPSSTATIRTLWSPALHHHQVNLRSASRSWSLQCISKRCWRLTVGQQN